MKTIIVASKNPVKLAAAQEGFARMFPGEEFVVQGVPAPSGVADQPGSDRETLQGALNRAENARQLAPQADYWVGIEGGIESTSNGATADVDGAMWAFAWVVVCSRDQVGQGRTGAFRLPPRVAELVRAGKELGEADDIVFGRTNSKQDNGAVGLLTGDVIVRRTFYAPAVILALIPIKNPDLYR